MTVLLTAGSASAAVPDAPWSANGTAVTTLRFDGMVRDPAFAYAVFDNPTGAWTFSATAKAARTQPIAWRHEGRHVALIEKFVTRGGKDIVKETLAGSFPGPAADFLATRPSSCSPATCTASGWRAAMRSRES